MEMMSILLLLFGIGMTGMYFDLRHKYKIVYSNYQNCLRALAENDPELKKYIENK